MPIPRRGAVCWYVLSRMLIPDIAYVDSCADWMRCAETAYGSASTRCTSTRSPGYLARVPRVPGTQGIWGTS
eukprot:706522-Rhodomonas_salina.3